MGILAQVRKNSKWCRCGDIYIVGAVPVLHIVVYDEAIGLKGR